jgi:hypothetical protein
LQFKPQIPTDPPIESAGDGTVALCLDRDLARRGFVAEQAFHDEVALFLKPARRVGFLVYVAGRYVAWSWLVIREVRFWYLRAHPRKSVFLGHFANDCPLKRTLTISTFIAIA